MEILQPLIRAWASNFSNPLFLVFTALSLVQLVQGWRRLAQLRPKWQEWQADPLNAWKKTFGEDISFYAAVPISVVIHELGHAIVVWAFSGHVIEFGYFFYWGYVLPDRVFPYAWQEWILASAGTWGNVVFALAIFLLFWNHRSPSWRYTARRTVRFQLFFAFLYYPIFTFILPIGDWRTIYNFNATPELSSAMVVVHLLILAGYWLGERRGWFTMQTFASKEEESLFTETLAQAEANPEDMQAQMAQLPVLLNSGSQQAGLQLAKKLMKQWPNSAEPLFYAILFEWHITETRVPLSSVKNAERLLDLPAPPSWHAVAHLALGAYQSELGYDEKARPHFDMGLRQANQQHFILYHRALLFIRQGQYNEARQDLELALKQAPKEPLYQYYLNQIKTK